MLKQEGGFIFLICDVFEVNFTIKFLKLTFDAESLLQFNKIYHCNQEIYYKHEEIKVMTVILPCIT